MTPDRTPERVIEEAQKLLGTGESPPGSNCNALTHRAGVGCVAWCDICVWTAWFHAGFQSNGRIDMAGIKTDYWFGDAYVPNTLRHFQAAGRLSRDPVPGAAEVFFWGGGERNSHIGIFVKSYGDGTHLNVEGNHNNVCEYVRRPDISSFSRGFCIPPFNVAVPEEDDMNPPQEAALNRVDIRTDNIQGAVHQLQLDMVSIKAALSAGASGAPIDIDAIAKAAAEELAKRLEQ